MSGKQRPLCNGEKIRSRKSNDDDDNDGNDGRTWNGNCISTLLGEHLAFLTAGVGAWGALVARAARRVCMHK